MMQNYIAALAIAAGSLTAVSASGDVAAEMIISRENDGIGVFLRLPFSQVEAVFGQTVPGFVDANGNPIFENLNEGTFEGADLLAQDVQFLLDGHTVGFDALSMMVHEAARPVPFETPLEAQIAISVCGVPLPEEIPSPDALVWLGGWYAYPVDAKADFDMVLPIVDGETVRLEIREFVDGTLRNEMSVAATAEVAVSVPGIGFLRKLMR